MAPLFYLLLVIVPVLSQWQISGVKKVGSTPAKLMINKVDVIDYNLGAPSNKGAGRGDLSYRMGDKTRWREPLSNAPFVQYNYKYEGTGGVTFKDTSAGGLGVFTFDDVDGPSADQITVKTKRNPFTDTTVSKQDLLTKITSGNLYFWDSTGGSRAAGVRKWEDSPGAWIQSNMPGTVSTHDLIMHSPAGEERPTLVCDAPVPVKDKKTGKIVRDKKTGKPVYSWSSVYHFQGGQVRQLSCKGWSQSEADKYTFVTNRGTANEAVVRMTKDQIQALKIAVIYNGRWVRMGEKRGDKSEFREDRGYEVLAVNPGGRAGKRNEYPHPHPAAHAVYANDYAYDDQDLDYDFDYGYEEAYDDYYYDEDMALYEEAQNDLAEAQLLFRLAKENMVQKRGLNRF